MRKPRSDSHLKTIDDPQLMREIHVFIAGDAEASPPSPPHSLAEGVIWLSGQGIATNTTSLWEFIQWYPTWTEFQEATQKIQAVRDAQEATGANLESEENVRAIRQHYLARAINRDDAKLYIALEKLRQKDEQLRLARERKEITAQMAAIAERRMKLQEEREARAMAAKAPNPKLTREESDKQIDEILRPRPECSQEEYDRLCAEEDAQAEAWEREVKEEERKRAA